MRRLHWLFMVALAAALPRAAATAQVEIDTLALKAHTYFLAHDLLRGRATGTTGAELAATYIASECRALGLVPADSNYLQSVPLEESIIEAGTEMRVAHRMREAHFGYPADFTPDVGNRTSLVDFSGPAVYVGPVGELRPESLRTLELQGAVAVTAGARVNNEVAAVLKELGAVAVVHLLGDNNTYQLYRRSRGGARLYHADPTVRSSFLPPIASVLAGPRLSYELVSGTPLERGQPMAPGPLGRHITFEIRLSPRKIAAANVACLLPGRDQLARDSLIAFTAHYDHLGVGEPDASGDAIYNGFSDNAAGVAMLLAIAQTMATGPTQRLRHSVLFLFLVGEERGLLGSDYFVADPIWPLDRIQAVINIDAGAPPGLQVSWRLAGVDSTGLGALAIAVAEDRGWSVTTSPPRANSDYYPFVREGIPAIFVIPGPDPFEGLSADSTAALRSRWDYYHKAGDHWTEDFPFVGVARYAEYGFLIAEAVDTTSTPLPRPERR
jgi:hypothetical protein